MRGIFALKRLVNYVFRKKNKKKPKRYYEAIKIRESLNLPETEDRGNRKAQGDRPMNNLKGRLLAAYRKKYEENLHQYIGACKISEYLNLTKEEHGLNYWKTHGLLMELKRDGYLEQSFRSGFRLKKELVIVEEVEESLKEKMLKTFKHLKQVHVERKKSTQNLYCNRTNQVAVCIKTSKAYPNDPTKKYWYTLTHGEKPFLEQYKKSYVFLGCLDNCNTAYLIPFHDYKEYFLKCSTTQTGWHININHKLYWFPSKAEEIDLSQFKVQLLSDENIEGLGSESNISGATEITAPWYKDETKEQSKTGGKLEVDLIRELEEKHKKLFSIKENTERLKKDMVGLCKETERLKQDMRDLSKDVSDLYCDYIEVIHKQKKNREAS
ncbi:MAG: hypothetical protein OXM55_00545 [Bdellovibrionales bacterium]|nr:hypothetical protein [Bdellovibrionales bacterium]